MPRFFKQSIDTDNIVIDGDDARHIGRSLRMKCGEEITVCCCGIDYNCKIKSFSEDSVYLELINSAPCAAEPDIDVTLFQAVPKLDKLEMIIQKSVELGANRIVPVLTHRCISRPSEKDFSKKLIPHLGYYIIVTDTKETENNYLSGLRDSIPTELQRNLVIKVSKTDT